MKRSACLLYPIFACASFAGPTFWDWAPTPPMGWNSWDSFATTVTEAQTRAQSEYMSDHLKAHGWTYVVVDIQWYEPGATGYEYRQDAPVVMDEWGRLLPAVNRFPSSANGAGFKPLADFVHGLGLKFGIHMMRGIPRRAVAQNLPVKGTNVRAADIADPSSICSWNSDMYGVDMSKPGAQAYYDSLFELIASWGVDYVKVDDMSRPYLEHEGEIEAVRRAIDKTGRPIVLSLSPGETALSAAEHVVRHANLWRISDDFWDSWPALYEQFARLEKWNPYRGPGHWPDADMLPFGVLDLGRRTSRFTPDEQFTVMSLWSIARSPLMFGGDMTKMDAFTLSLLTNDEVIAVNQTSTNNHPLFDEHDLVAWTADVPDSQDKYLAVFNARDRLPLNSDHEVFSSDVVSRETEGHETTISARISGATKLMLVVDDGGDGNPWDHALWIDPRLEMEDGAVMHLDETKWISATAGWGDVSTSKSSSGGPMMHDGVAVTRGIATHAKSVIEYKLPPGTVRFLATGAIDDAALKQDTGATIRFQVFTFSASDDVAAEAIKVPVDMNRLGFDGEVRIRDLWTHRDLGSLEGTFTPEVRWHGAGLYRISPAR